MNETYPRRAVLAVLGASTVAGCTGLPRTGGEDTTTEPLGSGRASDLAERFAPTLYFEDGETWFPTDPRPYADERGGRRVVHGFDAVDGYLRRFQNEGSPPDPTVFYNARTYGDSPLSVVQFWIYSAFDQFTTNFHWHDWEVLHVFVDDNTREPQLYVASSHSRQVPNNEFLDPMGRPRILSELGSHSSAISLNAQKESFQRFPGGDTFADVTNSGINAVEDLADFPLAYGLPRDEGYRLPYAMPELDGLPVYEHPELPHFERGNLVAPELTVNDFAELARPPTDLPARRTGRTVGFEGTHRGSFDLTYELTPTTDLEDIEAFTGPQLSFSFAVPGFVEDAVADHITSAATPWKQDRYRHPTADISDPTHRAALADRYDAVTAGGPAARLVGVVRDVVPDDDAPDGEGVTATEPTVEAVALIESEPTMVPSFGGVVAASDVEPGEHRLTINGAGRAPYTERVRADGTTTAGVQGQVGLVANADAVKLRVDTTGVDADLREFSVADDFGGPLYRTRLTGRAAVYVHAGGAYTAAVRDAENVPGAFRVNPSPGGAAPVTIDRPRTGKASLAEFVASVAAESRRTVKGAVGADSLDGSSGGSSDGGSGGSSDSGSGGSSDGGSGGSSGGGSGGSSGGGSGGSSSDSGTPTGGDGGGGAGGGGGVGGVEGLLTALEAVQTAASRAVQRAEAGDRNGTDRQLQGVRTRLSKVGDALATVSGDLPPPASRAVDLRLERARTRTNQALAVEKL